MDLRGDLRRVTVYVYAVVRILRAIRTMMHIKAAYIEFLVPLKMQGNQFHFCHCG